jgi:hypothetical protein
MDKSHHSSTLETDHRPINSCEKCLCLDIVVTVGICGSLARGHSYACSCSQPLAGLAWRLCQGGDTGRSSFIATIKQVSVDVEQRLWLQPEVIVVLQAHSWLGQCTFTEDNRGPKSPTYSWLTLGLLLRDVKGSKVKEQQAARQDWRWPEPRPTHTHYKDGSPAGWRYSSIIIALLS